MEREDDVDDDEKKRRKDGYIPNRIRTGGREDGDEEEQEKRY